MTFSGPSARCVNLLLCEKYFFRINYASTRYEPVEIHSGWQCFSLNDLIFGAFPERSFQNFFSGIVYQ